MNDKYSARDEAIRRVQDRVIDPEFWGQVRDDYREFGGHLDAVVAMALEVGWKRVVETLEWQALQQWCSDHIAQEELDEEERVEEDRRDSAIEYAIEARRDQMRDDAMTEAAERGRPWPKFGGDWR